MFVLDHAAYFFVAADGRRGDIKRVQTFQPGIDDPDNYLFYMWVEAVQGYFLLVQRFEEGQPQNWYLIGEMTTEKTGPAVFDEWSDLLREKLAK